MLIRWRPKSSITSVPQLLFSCSGASLMPVALLTATSSEAMVSSPPATIVGRRMRTQRLSICRWSQRPLPGSSGSSTWFTGSNSRQDIAVDADGARDPDGGAEGPRDPLGDARLAVARAP